MDLNLASRPFKNNTLLWVGYVLAFIALAAFTSWNIIAWRDHVAKLADLQNTVQSIESRMLDLDQREERATEGIKTYDLEALELQAAKANEVIAWKAFSWTQLFNRMEIIQPYDVRMTSIRPLFRPGMRRDRMEAEENGRKSIAVAVEGVAKDFDAFWEMQHVLLADEHFGKVDPERLNKGEKREIIFQLSFQYYPGDEEEVKLTEVAVEAPAVGEAEGTVEEPEQEAEPEQEPGQEAQQKPVPPEEAEAQVAGPPQETPAEAAPERQPRAKVPTGTFTKGRRKAKGAGR
jgi:hypothetical protein